MDLNIKANYLMLLITLFGISVFFSYFLRGVHLCFKIIPFILLLQLFVIVDNFNDTYAYFATMMGVLYVYRDYLKRWCLCVGYFISNMFDYFFRFGYFLCRVFKLEQKNNYSGADKQKSYERKNYYKENIDREEELNRAREEVRKARAEAKRAQEELNKQKEQKKRAKKPDTRTAREILGLPIGPITKSELKKAWATACKKYHADKHQQMSDEFIQEVEEEFRKIQKAYKELLSEVKS